MRIGISQSNYLPWIGFFELINSCDKFVLLDSVQYTKNDWRNRNKIWFQNNEKWMTIPVHLPLGLRTPINRVEIADSKWRANHLSLIRSSYFKTSKIEILDLLEAMYKDCDSLMLSKVNSLILSTICDYLSIKTELITYSKPDNLEDKTLRLVKICQSLGATIYVSSTAAKSYLNESLFRDQGIEVEWLDFTASFDFINREHKLETPLSIIDTLFRSDIQEIERHLHNYGNC